MVLMIGSTDNDDHLMFFSE